MVDLQYCAGFRNMAKGFSYAYTYIHYFKLSGDKPGDWDWCLHSTVYGIDNQQGHYSSGNSTQYSVIANMGKRISFQFYWDIIDICVYSVSQSCPSLWDPMDYSPPGFSVHRISQARILGWDAISFSRGSSRPRDQTHISCAVRRILCHWTTWEAPIRT